MIDLTPLDVRKKRGDFRKALRGYDPQEVDVFLELVAERMEALVRQNIQMRERSEQLQEQVSSSTGREHAVQEALVTAQELREDIRGQAQREAELIVQEAHRQAQRHVAEGERRVEAMRDVLAELERRRARFLKRFRQLLERELDSVEVEEVRAPLEERAIELNLGGGHEEEPEEPEAEELREPETAADVPDGEEFGEAPVDEDVPVHEAFGSPEDDDPDPIPRQARHEEDLFALPDIQLPGDDDDRGEGHYPGDDLAGR